MPISYQIDGTAGLIRTRCWGEVVIDEVRSHFQTLVRDPNLTGRPDVFLDLREMNSLPTADEIREASEIIARLPATVRFGACAIIAQRDALYGMSRMFSVFAEQFFSAISAFRSAPEAEAWLREQRAHRRRPRKRSGAPSREAGPRE
jgi:hypothetical protein